MQMKGVYGNNVKIHQPFENVILIRSSLYIQLHTANISFFIIFIYYLFLIFGKCHGDFSPFKIPIFTVARTWKRVSQELSYYTVTLRLIEWARKCFFSVLSARGEPFSLFFKKLINNFMVREQRRADLYFEKRKS